MDLMSEVFVETVFLPSLFFFSGRLVFFTPIFKNISRPLRLIFITRFENLKS